METQIEIKNEEETGKLKFCINCKYYCPRNYSVRRVYDVFGCSNSIVSPQKMDLVIGKLTERYTDCRIERGGSAPCGISGLLYEEE